MNKALKKYNINPRGYEKIGNVTFINTNEGKYVYKKEKINPEILEYLHSRNFDYFPKLISSKNDEYEIYKYIDEYNIPKQQKILDLVNLTALLHSKTTHYEEFDKGDYQQIYEDLDGNIRYLYDYYTDLITIIESKVYMSPSEMLLARNISIIYDSLSDTKKRLENWHDIIKDSQKIRKTLNHGNLNLNHFITNEKPYLISWRKAKLENPVFDLYRLYLNHALEFDFEDIFSVYEKNYPLKKEEKMLLYILISFPDIIKLNGSEYQKCKTVQNMVDKLYKTNKLISPENFKTTD